MAGLSCAGARRDKNDIRTATRRPCHPRSGSIRNKSLYFGTVVDIGETLVDFKIIGRANPQIFARSEISGTCGGGEPELSAHSQFPSLVGVACSVAQLILEESNVHALCGNAVTRSLCRKVTEICGQILTVNILIVELCLDRQFIICRIGIFLAE